MIARRLAEPTLLAALIAPLGTFAGLVYTARPPQAPAPAPAPPAMVVARVIDGDTLVCRPDDGGPGGEVTVRLLLVDAPEHAQHPWGVAAQYWAAIELAGRPVTLVGDPKARADPYGRALRYVYYRKGDRTLLFNAEIARAGWAFYYDPGPALPLTDAVRKAEAEAKKANRGVHRPGHFPLQVPSEFRKGRRTPKAA